MFRDASCNDIYCISSKNQENLAKQFTEMNPFLEPLRIARNSSHFSSEGLFSPDHSGRLQSQALSPRILTSKAVLSSFFYHSSMTNRETKSLRNQMKNRWPYHRGDDGAHSRTKVFRLQIPSPFQPATSLS